MAPRVLSLLCNNSISIVGVHVGGDLAHGDLAWFGCNFDCEVNLGQYSRNRDAVQNRSVGLKHLVRSILQLLVEKNDKYKSSNWNADELIPDQIKYAWMDVDGSLMLYEELSKTPDLTARLTGEQAIPGK